MSKVVEKVHAPVVVPVRLGSETMSESSEMSRIDAPVVVLVSPENRTDPPIRPVSMFTASFPVAVAVAGTPNTVVGVGIDVVIVTSLWAVPAGLVGMVGFGGGASLPELPQAVIMATDRRAAISAFAMVNRLCCLIMLLS